MASHRRQRGASRLTRLASTIVKSCTRNSGGGIICFRMAPSERKAVVGTCWSRTGRGKRFLIHAGGSASGPCSIHMYLLPSFRIFPGTGCAATHTEISSGRIRRRGMYIKALPFIGHYSSGVAHAEKRGGSCCNIALIDLLGGQTDGASLCLVTSTIVETCVRFGVKC
jgi:hypothetical protein